MLLFDMCVVIQLNGATFLLFWSYSVWSFRWKRQRRDFNQIFIGISAKHITNKPNSKQCAILYAKMDRKFDTIWCVNSKKHRNYWNIQMSRFASLYILWRTNGVSKFFHQFLVHLVSQSMFNVHRICWNWRWSWTSFKIEACFKLKLSMLFNSC